MTTQEAIEILTEMRDCNDYITQSDALQMAIDELEKKPAANSEDTISRQAVLNILDDMVKDYIKENDFDKAQGVAWVKVQKLSSISTDPCTHDKPCTECSQYDNEKHYCPHFCHVIRNVFEEVGETE